MQVTLPGGTRLPRSLVIAVALLGCAGGRATQHIPPTAADCSADRLASCAARLLAEEAPTPVAVTAYASARLARDANDPWARLWQALNQVPPSAKVATSAILVIEGANPPLPETPELPTLRTLRIDPLPPVDGGDDVRLLVAMAKASGYHLAFRARQGAVTELFPGDPLSPFVAGLVPVLPDGPPSGTSPKT